VSQQPITHKEEKKTKFLVNKKSDKEATKIKYKIPFLKEFNIKFTKRENIDKKVLRKFRKFIKDKIKKGHINLSNFGLNNTQKEFWNFFIDDNFNASDEIQRKSRNN